MALSKKKTAQLWIWKAYDRDTGQLIDGECGGRDRATLQRFIDRVQAWKPRLICTDGSEPYAVVLPVGRHDQGKDQTFNVERTNGQQRHGLARLRRRTCVVSRARRRVEASIALFARFHVNGSLQDLAAILS